MLPTLPENFKVLRVLKPAADAAGRTGVPISLKHAHKAWIIANIDQGNAATILLSLSQSTTVAGAGAKAVTALFPIWACQDSIASDALVKQALAANFTTNAAVKEKCVVFEVAPETVLDIAGGFDCVALVTGASNAANITSAIAVIATRYLQASPPSAIVD